MDSPRLIAVLPCYSLDDIAKNLNETTCQEFHAAWTVLWHPSLLARTHALPEWKRADQGSLDIENGLIVCPASSSASLDTPLMERLESQSCQLIFADPDRKKTLDKIDQLFEGQLGQVPPELVVARADGDSPSESPALDLLGDPKSTIRIDDFYGLGFAYLMLQALTRKVHYSTNLDVVLMADQAKSAALAYLANDATECERWLQSCFDQLSQERDRYFTQTANLLELTLLAPSTLGRSVLEQLQNSQTQNFLASTRLLEELRSLQPDAWRMLIERHTAQRIGIIGGLPHERAHPWFPLGTLQRDLIRGQAAYQALQISPPRVFARFDPGMSNEMPTHLRSAGYIGVLLHAFSSGRYPVTSQAKIAWEASDATSLDAISSAVIDAASYRSIFNAINELAKQFDHHQVPTLTCVHWPARTAVAFDDLVRATRRTSAFGEWKTFDNYFETTGYVYSNETFSSSQFKFPWPESYAEFSLRALRMQTHKQRTAALESTRNIAVLVGRILKTLPNRQTDLESSLRHEAKIEKWLYRCDDRAERDGDGPTIDDNEVSLEELRSQVAQQLAALIPRTTASSDQNQAWLIINPYSGPRRYFVKALSGTFAKTPDNRIYESIAKTGQTDLIVDAPPMGVVRVSDESKSRDATSTGVTGRGHGPNIASPNLLLANEFIECQVDPKNGYLRSIMIAKKRGGKLSGMPAIAMLDPSSTKKPIYSTIENTQSKVISNTPLYAELESNGELWLDGKNFAKFQLGFSLWRGSRAIDLRLRIEMIEKSIGDRQGLWDRVPIWRTAWPSQAASISAWIHGTKTKMGSAQFFAPELLEVDDAEHRLYLATSGLPIHRRVDHSFLDSLLPIDRQGLCEQRFQIAVDWPRPYQSYLEFFDEPWLIEDPAGPLRAGSSLWFAQANVPNVRIDPLANHEKMRVLLHESMGKEGRAKLSLFRDATSAARVDQRGNIIEELAIDKGQVLVDLKPNEISYLDIE